MFWPVALHSDKVSTIRLQDHGDEKFSVIFIPNMYIYGDMYTHLLKKYE